LNGVVVAADVIVEITEGEPEFDSDALIEPVTETLLEPLVDIRADADTVWDWLGRIVEVSEAVFDPSKEWLPNTEYETVSEFEATGVAEFIFVKVEYIVMDDEIVVELDHEILDDGDTEFDAELNSLPDSETLLDSIEDVDADLDGLIEDDEETDMLSCSVGDPEIEMEYEAISEFDSIDE